ncbi:hypothetical protein G6F59_014687 [Rhizopus arrhizus]|nr:hypothetical protein G6F59_014687 [Rhizopus arrhizus]
MGDGRRGDRRDPGLHPVLRRPGLARRCIELTAMTASDSTERFSSRVADYVRYRPDYPPALLQWLHHPMGVSHQAQVADIGAGTGISSRLFLATGHPVVAVEPNAAMRGAAEAWLAPQYPQFRAVDGRAEATGLDDASIDLVSVAQAFHWFDTVAVRAEWQRILRPGGQALIYWNSRLLDASPFLRGGRTLPGRRHHAGLVR